jgi:hypothetical protein
MPGLTTQSFSDGRRAPLTYYRHINLANATRDELEQLAEACKPTSSDMNKKALTDGPGKMDFGSFAPLLVPGQTNLVKVRDRDEMVNAFVPLASRETLYKTLYVVSV